MTAMDLNFPDIEADLSFAVIAVSDVINVSCINSPTTNREGAFKELGAINKWLDLKLN